MLKLGGELAAVESTGELVRAGGGAANAVVLHHARNAGLGGFEFACAIPGTIGGGVWMNGGAYGGDFAQVLERVLVATAEGSGYLTPAELGLSYRHSNLRHGQVVVAAELRLRPRDPVEIKNEVRDLNARRKAAQPTNRRTFGSVFKNPDHELTAGRMLEACGLKGHRIGGAQISPKHANFIENAGGAATADAIALMAEARRRANEQYGVELRHEVEFLGELDTAAARVGAPRPRRTRAGGPAAPTRQGTGAACARRLARRCRARGGCRPLQRSPASHRRAARSRPVLASSRSPPGSTPSRGRRSAFAISTLEVDGAPAAVQQQVKHSLAPLLGTNLLALDGAALERRAEALPTVVSIGYDRAFPHTLRIHVVPERPVAVLRRGKETWLVSARGRVVARIPTGTDPGSHGSGCRGRPTSHSARSSRRRSAARQRGRSPPRRTSRPGSRPSRSPTATSSSGSTPASSSGSANPTDVRLKLAIARRALAQLPPGATYLDISVPGRPVAGCGQPSTLKYRVRL